MLTLLTFPPSFQEPSHSPFCVKAMCLLELSGVPWQRKDVGMPAKMPLGRLPVLKDGGELIPDSAHIQSHLEAKGAQFDAALSTAQKAQSHALVRMVEDHLRCGLVYDRWLDDRCWPEVKSVFFAKLPLPLKWVVPGMIQRKVKRSLLSHGIAQYTPKDRLARLSQDLDTLTATLRDQPFLFGNVPTAADAAIAPHLSMIAHLPGATELRQTLHANRALMAYLDRARAAMYPT